MVDEETIVGFLTGQVRSERLESEAAAAVERVSTIHERVYIRPRMESPCIVTREMVLRLCDAALAGQLSPSSLRIIAFAIVSSDTIEWDKGIVGEVLHDWSAPEVNWALSKSNLIRFRRWITDEEPYPAKPQ